MKKLTLLLMLLGGLNGCATLSQSSGLQVTDGQGYTRAAEKLLAEVQNANPADSAPVAVIALTSDTESALFKQQDEIIAAMDAEDLGFLYVVGDAAHTYSHGYHLSQNDSQQLLGNHQLKILIVSADGISRNSVTNRTASARELMTLMANARQ
ncbi:MAG: hypothetical protein CMI08_10875 [Oceanospirillaceae bacterium]|uniref:hypothetical protein n=1 Tax=unclassified Thalassolituus TaxID=2624967 RepID=UPI000C53E4F2|nr:MULTISPECIES: hypothetical protein [unclassified Thalassolituus]MAS24157.1 hypothetical protein [Oceanospirillaceae bacterium]MAX99682.1 hypothetical protein [Oceanospirillaceae bacterium]MBL35431.1 hypothetical protein [Oceanospirillaceae bacterium]MBS51886.1 hypothetical protein [Oceanospirillaceae bacterium]MBS52909.1 hypothetical protein [Oceanospirillaceae bacterium]|tara:strand:- start:4385 stop:4843 length:459 start_codon:yes stop_codon:yes gene_type:complete